MAVRLSDIPNTSVRLSDVSVGTRLSDIPETSQAVSEVASLDTDIGLSDLAPLEPSLAGQGTKPPITDTTLSKPIPKAIADGFTGAGINLTQTVAGFAEIAGEFITPSEKARQKAVFPGLTNFWDKQSTRLKEWATTTREAVDIFRKENPDQQIQLKPVEGGIVKKAVGVAGQAITDPAILTQGLVETVPMLLEATLGFITGSKWLGLSARLGRILGMRIKIIPRPRGIEDVRYRNSP